MRCSAISLCLSTWHQPLRFFSCLSFSSSLVLPCAADPRFHHHFPSRRRSTAEPSTHPTSRRLHHDLLLPCCLASDLPLRGARSPVRPSSARGRLCFLCGVAYAHFSACPHTCSLAPAAARSPFFHARSSSCARVHSSRRPAPRISQPARDCVLSPRSRRAPPLPLAAHALVPHARAHLSRAHEHIFLPHELLLPSERSSPLRAIAAVVRACFPSATPSPAHGPPVPCPFPAHPNHARSHAPPARESRAAFLPSA